MYRNFKSFLPLNNMGIFAGTAEISDQVISQKAVLSVCTLSSFLNHCSVFFGNVKFWILRRSCGGIEYR
jgi:hypothetical protein